MACPDCCAAITITPIKDRNFHTWEYIVNSAKYFYGIERINLTGGEPSIHPNFSEWIPKIKELFGCKTLDIWTNGTMFKKKAETWKHFDNIHITNYTEKSYPGSPNNSKEIEFIREFLKDTNVNVYATEVEHIPMEHRGTKPCFRAFSDTVEFVNGKIYPCCAASGLEIKRNISLSENWRKEILQVIPPCEVCLFAEA